MKRHHPVVIPVKLNVASVHGHCGTYFGVENLAYFALDLAAAARMPLGSRRTA